MKNEIYEIGRYSGYVYGLRCVVCTNDETTTARLGSDETGNGHKESADRIQSETWRAFEKEIGGMFSCETDSHFPNWHGGKYSHQSATYGYENGPGHSKIKCYRAEITRDEDGDEEPADWDSCELSDFPAAIRERIEVAIRNADKAVDAVIAEIEKEIEADAASAE